jgi:CubicO group peptidase (beta-lactamase class C family)
MKPVQIFRSISLVVSCVSVLLMPGSVSASTQDVGVLIEHQKANERLDDYFAALLKHNKFIGSVAVYKNGQLTYQNALSMTDESSGKVSNSNKTLQYRIGSISKTFTSVMILQLIEEGELSLNSQLSEFYPKVKNAKNISIEQLLTHHSGIRSFTDDPKFWGIYLKPQTSSTILGMIEAYDAEFEPGSQGKYSNSNYYLLGHIIESITKSNYSDNLKSRIVDKAGLTNTYYGGKIGSEDNEVPSYAFTNDSWRLSPESDMSVPHGAGAVVSTTHDLNQFMYALFGETLISKTSLDSMLKMDNGFGKGVFAANHAGADGYGHGGSIDGFRSLLQYIPQTKVSFAILSNGLNFSQKQLADDLVRASTGKLVDIPDFTEIKVAPQQIQQMVGQYTSKTHPLGIVISEYQGKLLAKADGQGAFPLTAKSQTLFEFKDAGIEMTFDIKAKRFVIKQGSRKDTFTRNESPTVTVPDHILQSYSGIYTSPDFPMDIAVRVEEGALMAQATGQGAFPLTPQSNTEFWFVLAGIEINFDASKSQLIISQGGNDTVMTKK